MMSSSKASGCSKATENCPLLVQLGALCGQTSEQTRGQFCARTKGSTGQNISYPIFQSCTSDEGWFWLCWAAVFNRMYVVGARIQYETVFVLIGLRIVREECSRLHFKQRRILMATASDASWVSACQQFMLWCDFVLDAVYILLHCANKRKCTVYNKPPQWSVESEKFVLMFSETG